MNKRILTLLDVVILLVATSFNTIFFELIYVCVYSLVRLGIAHKGLDRYIPLILLLAWVNSTKLISADLYNYGLILDTASKLSLGPFLMENIKSPFFYIWFWVFNALTISFVNSLIVYFGYLLMISSIDRYFTKSGDKIVASILLIFYFNLFDMSGHLLRQFLAGSILIYSVIQANKKGLIIAGLCHLSSLFGLSYFVKNFKQLILFCIAVTLLLLVPEIQKIFFIYIYNKSTHSIIEFVELGILENYIILLSLICLFSKHFRSHYLRIVLFLSGSIFLFNENTELCLRLFQYFHFLIPFIVITISNLLYEIHKSLAIKGVINISFVALFIFNFIYRMTFNPNWSYFNI